MGSNDAQAGAASALGDTVKEFERAKAAFDEARPYAKRRPHRGGQMYTDAAASLREARERLRAATIRAVRSGMSQTDASRISGISPAQVSRLVRGATSGNDTLPPAEFLVDTLPAEQIAKRYKAGENTRELSEAFGCSRATIAEILERRGVPRDARPGPSKTVLPDREILERRRRGESFRMISMSYGVSRETVRRRVREAQAGNARD